jgi:MATE family multidrug resistance protein
MTMARLFADVRKEWPTIARLAAPIAAAQAGMMGLNVVDTAVVGHTTREQLAGASLGRAITFLAITIGLGMSAALEPLTSQAVAALEPDRAWRTYLRGLIANLCVWPPSVIFALELAHALPRISFLHLDAETSRATTDFVWGNAPGMLMFNAFCAVKALLQSWADTRPLYVATLFANLVNAPVATILVRGDEGLAALGLPGLGFAAHGAFGAGLASSIASAALILWVAFAAVKFRAPGQNPVPGIGSILRLGFPISCALMAEVGALSTVAMLSAHFGTAQVAAFQIALMLFSLAFMAAIGVSGATTVVVGKSVGMGRAALSSGIAGVALGTTVMAMGALLFISVPEPLMRVFSSDVEVISIGRTLLGVAAVFLLFEGVQVVATGALRGAGDVRYPSIVLLSAHWVVGLPLALLFGFRWGLGVVGMWRGLAIGSAFAATVLASRLCKIATRPIARL